MQGFHLFTFKNIPVSVQPFFFILILILAIPMGSGIGMLLFAVNAILGVLIHEFGHALTARHFHLNPEIILGGFGGITQHATPSNKRQDFLVTLAGPMAGLVTGGILYAIFKLSLLTPAATIWVSFPNLTSFFYYMLMINLMWGIFNLIPIRPMDGGRLLAHLLAKVARPSRVENILSLTSVVLAGLLLAYAVLNAQSFMIFIAIYLLVINFGPFLNLFKKDQKTPKMQLVGIQAEAIYEKGLVAARRHDWNALEVLGHQMKRASEGPEQLERAYELLTIACTNLGKYDEALGYAKRARQSDSVKKATERCKRCAS